MNNSIIRYSNCLIFLIVLAGFLVLKTYEHFSTSLIDTLPESSNKRLLKQIEAKSSTSKLMLYLQTNNENSLSSFKQLQVQMEQLPFLKKEVFKENSVFQKHQEEYFYHIASLNEEKLQNLDITKQLNILYQQLQTSFFPVIIDKQDPLEIFNQNTIQPFSFEKGFIKLDEHTFMLMFEVVSQNLQEHTQLYDLVQELLQQYPSVKVFSPIFYHVENTRLIKEDINFIIALSVSVLLLLYLFLVRNIWLLINTLSTLATSSMLAFIILSMFYEKLSIFVLAFGISISTVAIDYMFHHYVHGHYYKKFGFNKEVWYGFITTTLAFFIFSFCSFTLIKQICLFTVLSLSISYIHFAFLYPKLSFQQTSVYLFLFNGYRINTKRIFIIALLSIITLIGFVKMDLNIKNLDVDNSNLQQKENFFQQILFKEKQTMILIKANSIDNLIMRAKKIKQIVPSVYIPLAKLATPKSENFKQQLNSISQQLNQNANKIGFKEGIFQKSYQVGKKSIQYTLEDLNQFGLKVMVFENHFYTVVSLPLSAVTKMEQFDFIQELSIKKLFENSLKDIFKEFIVLGLVVVMMIILIIFGLTKSKSLYAFNFILFPLAVVMIYFAFFGINILNLFMLFIILSIGIDYAFYSSYNQSAQTNSAIIYSLLSTFAGFGVLSLSSISALYSIGFVAVLGIVAIFIILYFFQGAQRDISCFK